MKGRWCVMACCGAGMALLGFGRSWGQAQNGRAGRFAPGAALVEVVVPASGRGEGGGPRALGEPGAVFLGKVVGADRQRGGLITQYAPVDARTLELQSGDGMTLLLPDGILLKLHQAEVMIVPSGTDGGRRILIAPLPAPARK